MVLLFSSCSVAQCPRTRSECQDTGSNPYSKLVDLKQEPLLGEFSNQAISTWSMNSVPSHGIAAALCSWDCSSISRRGRSHRLLVRARAWGLPQRGVVQLNIIKDIAGKRPMQTNYLLQWWFLPWDVGFVVSKLLLQIRQYIMHHLHPFEKVRTKPHPILVLTSPSLPPLSSGIPCGTLYVNSQN